MERKIGEIFKYNGEWYQCVKSDGTCNGCVGKFQPYSFCNGSKECAGKIFKKLEKWGNPYPNADKLYQLYILPMNIEKLPPHTEGINLVRFDIVEIEIKQTKEDMEEKNQDIIEFQGKKYKFIPHEGRDACSMLCAFKNLSQRDCWDIPCSPRERRDALKGYFVELSSKETTETLVDEVKINIENQDKNNMETSKLKPFSLEAAKQGKPVYTKDGRKVRIICFDAKCADTPIVALVSCKNEEESLLRYYRNGKFRNDEDSDADLMMLPEKKEGWYNVYKSCIYSTKEEAEKVGETNCGFIKTIKVEWEE